MDAKIAGIIPAGTLVEVRHDGHPIDGTVFTVTGNNGGVGGLGGGGAVFATDPYGQEHVISRYTRVVIVEPAL